MNRTLRNIGQSHDRRTLLRGGGGEGGVSREGGIDQG